jgi:hypothetical protein
MAEPKEVAQTVEEVVPGVWHWRVHDDRIDFLSAAHALAAADGVVLIDPLPLAVEALAGLGAMHAIVLTSGSHQRSAWRFRRELGVPVHAPALSRTLEEEPDIRYGDGDLLPGGLRAVFTPGAGTTQHTLLRETAPAVAFVSDLFARGPGEPLVLVPARYMHDPAEARRSAGKLLELPFSILCVAHGVPVVDDPKAAIRAALES